MKKNRKTKVEISDSILKETITSIFEVIQKERKEDPEYRDLFKKSISGDSLLSEMNFKMEGIVLNGCEILTEKFGYKKINDNLYCFLLALPLINHLLENRIIESEGPACCVDKTSYLLAKALQKYKVEKEKP
jgi:hypothetical protein